MWITEELAHAVKDGLIPIPPPLLTRIYMELSQSTLAFNQAVKVDKIPFPFVYAHHCVVCLCSFLLLYPLGMYYFSGTVYYASISAFLLGLGFYSIMESAREIEEPFNAMGH